jgi:hypothetical protein
MVERVRCVSSRCLWCVAGASNEVYGKSKALTRWKNKIKNWQTGLSGVSFVWSSLEGRYRETVGSYHHKLCHVSLSLFC